MEGFYIYDNRTQIRGNKMKIALFSFKNLVDVILDHEPINGDEEFTQLSEWVEVDFKRIPPVVEHNYCYDYE